MIWRKIALRTNQADPFCCSPEWQLSFHEAFSPLNRKLLETTQDSVIAFTEHILAPEQVFLTPLEVNWFFGCPLLGKDALSMLVEALGRQESDHAPYTSNVVISGIRPGEDLSRRVLRTFGKSHTIFLHSKGIQCAASLAGGVDGFLSRRSANHRGKLNKALRKARAHDVYFERVIPSSPEETRAAFDRILAIESRSWKGLDQCGITEAPADRFYEILLCNLSGLRLARIIFAKHDDQDIGFIFGGLAGKIYRGQQFSYDQAWKDFSIGNLMQLEKIIWLCEEGMERYDMGPIDGPRMEYKAHWTEKTLPIQTWILVKS